MNEPRLSRVYRQMGMHDRRMELLNCYRRLINDLRYLCEDPHLAHDQTDQTTAYVCDQTVSVLLREERCLRDLSDACFHKESKE